jgi:hypothetical protein
MGVSLGQLAQTARELGMTLADGFIEVFVPHIVDSASSASHDECAEAEKSQIRERRAERRLKRIRSHGDRPSCEYFMTFPQFTSEGSCTTEDGPQG